ncbi:MAG: hypothetical protein HZA90_15890 [Verrucomicrobia bacterium]|nr:hypothetical protein [Verrucomicrobiota bacterium]
MKLPRHPILLGVGVLVSLIALFVLVEHLRGRWMLHRELARLRANGESIVVADLTPPMPPPEKNGAAVFLAAATRLGWNSPNGVVTIGVPGAWKAVAPGKVRVAWQARSWKRFQQPTATNLVTAEQLIEDVRANREALEAIHASLRTPALQFEVQYSMKGQWPRLMPSKQAAQWLRAASLCGLFESDLAGSLTNLESLAFLVKKQSEDRMLIDQLVAIADASIGVAAMWEALQAPGWTEPQLARLQVAWSGPDFNERMTRAFEMERAMMSGFLEEMTAAELDAFITGGWITPTPAPAATWSSLDAFMKDLPELCVRALRRGVFLPLYYAAWSDQDKARLLQQHGSFIKAAREVSATHSLAAVKAMIPQNTDELWEFGEPQRHKTGVYDRCRFLVASRSVEYAWSSISKACTADAWRTLAVTAIALQRYQLRHGKLAPTLDALVPEFMSAVPLDPMDGKLLRYRLNADGRFTLYSVGDDGVDNGGDASPKPNAPTSSYSVVHGKDLVWPAPATEEEIKEAEAKSEQSKLGRR